MSQEDFKYKNDYPAFLASNPNPQQVVDFVVYLEGLPNLTIQDAQAGIAACQLVKHQSTYIRKLGYNYDSQFIVYEAIFRISQNDVFEKSLESFEKTIAIGLQASSTLSPYSQDGTRMALRTELLLRYPDHFGYPQTFQDLEKAQSIKQARLNKQYFSEQQCFQTFVKHDINQAVGYTVKGWRSYYYCQLYINKDKEAVEYFKRLYQGNPRQNIIAAINYMHGLQYQNKEAAANFSEELQAFVKKQADAQGFTRWARMDLKVHSHINGFDVIPWVIAGPDEPSELDVNNALRHCDMGIEKISSMKIGPYEYRNKVFLYETKGWIYTHLKEKTYENYINALKSYYQALKLYVDVDDYQKMLQFVLSRYSGIVKQALILFTSPGHFNFSNSFKTNQQAEQLYKQYVDMVSAESKGFPYQKRLKLIFELGAQMNLIKNVDNKIFQEKQSSLADFIVDESQQSDDNQTKAKVTRIINQYKAEAQYLEEILADKKLNAYYEGFISTFLDTYALAIRVIQDRQVKALKSEVPIKITAFFSKLVPLLGEQIICTPEKLFDLAVTPSTKSRGSYIGKMAPNLSRLNSFTQTLAIKVIELHSDTIKQLEYQAVKNQKEHIDQIEDIIDKIGAVQQNLYDQSQLLKSIQMEMGNRHSTIIIDRVIAAGEISKLSSSEDAKKIDIILAFLKQNSQLFQISTLIKKQNARIQSEGEGNKTTQKPVTLQNQAQGTGNSKVDAGCLGDGGCMVYTLFDIIYDDPLLNQKSLRQRSFECYGIHQVGNFRFGIDWTRNSQ